MGEQSKLQVMTRKPTHPGEMLREKFMFDYGISVAQLALRLGVSRQTANELVHERRSVSAEMALRLARLFGTTPEYWASMQSSVDLWDSLERNRKAIADIVPLPVPQDDALEG